MSLFKRTDWDWDPFIKSNANGSITLWRGSDGDFCMCANTAPEDMWKNNPDIAQSVYETAFVFHQATKEAFKEAYGIARLILRGYKLPTHRFASYDGSFRIYAGNAHLSGFKG